MFLFQALSSDRDGLVKLKNSIKEISKTGNSHASCGLEYSRALNRMGEAAIVRDDESDDIGAAFQKFAVVTKELSILLKGLVSRFRFRPLALILGRIRSKIFTFVSSYIPDDELGQHHRFPHWSAPEDWTERLQGRPQTALRSVLERLPRKVCWLGAPEEKGRQRSR